MTYPNTDPPGCKENSEKNRHEHMKMPPRYERYDRRPYRYDRRPFEGGKKKPKVGKMSAKMKKSFVRAMVANGDY